MPIKWDPLTEFRLTLKTPRLDMSFVLPTYVEVKWDN